MSMHTEKKTKIMDKYLGTPGIGPYITLIRLEDKENPEAVSSEDQLTPQFCVVEDDVAGYSSREKKEFLEDANKDYRHCDEHGSAGEVIKELIDHWDSEAGLKFSRKILEEKDIWKF